MKLSAPLISKLEKRYQPSALVEMKYKGKDLAFKTDDEGNPIILFIGRLRADGKVKGERYKRTLIRDAKGVVIKDHWDMKGRT